MEIKKYFIEDKIYRVLKWQFKDDLLGYDIEHENGLILNKTLLCRIPSIGEIKEMIENYE